MSINKKLSTIQTELGSAFKDADELYKKLIPILEENGLGITISDEVVELGGQFFMKSTLTLSGDEDCISTTGVGEESEKGRKVAHEGCLSGMFLCVFKDNE